MEFENLETTKQSDSTNIARPIESRRRFIKTFAFMVAGVATTSGFLAACTDGDGATSNPKQGSAAESNGNPSTSELSSFAQAFGAEYVTTTVPAAVPTLSSSSEKSSSYYDAINALPKVTEPEGVFEGIKLNNGNKVGVWKAVKQIDGMGRTQEYYIKATADSEFLSLIQKEYNLLKISIQLSLNVKETDLPKWIQWVEFKDEKGVVYRGIKTKSFGISVREAYRSGLVTFDEAVDIANQASALHEKIFEETKKTSKSGKGVYGTDQKGDNLILYRDEKGQLVRDSTGKYKVTALDFAAAKEQEVIKSATRGKGLFQYFTSLENDPEKKMEAVTKGLKGLATKYKRFSLQRAVYELIKNRNLDLKGLKFDNFVRARGDRFVNRAFILMAFADKLEELRAIYSAEEFYIKFNTEYLKQTGTSDEKIKQIETEMFNGTDVFAGIETISINSGVRQKLIDANRMQKAVSNNEATKVLVFENDLSGNFNMPLFGVRFGVEKDHTQKDTLVIYDEDTGDRITDSDGKLIGTKRAEVFLLNTEMRNEKIVMVFYPAELSQEPKGSIKIKIDRANSFVIGDSN